MTADVAGGQQAWINFPLFILLFIGMPGQAFFLAAT